MSAIFSCLSCRYQYLIFQDDLTLNFGCNLIVDCSDLTVGSHSMW